MRSAAQLSRSAKSRHKGERRSSVLENSKRVSRASGTVHGEAYPQGWQSRASVFDISALSAATRSAQLVDQFTQGSVDAV